MAYYKKEEVVEFINSSCEKIKSDRHTPLTDPQKSLTELTEEQDLVGFFWLELSSSGENGVGIQMEGKVFVKLDSETYTDDRFALDSYHAAKEGVSVTDIIKKRAEEKNNASKEISPDVIENLKNLLSTKNM
jgi:hypothetical protein